MMKRLILSFYVGIFSVASVFAIPSFALAADSLPNSVIIMIVDEQQIVTQSKAGQTIKAKRDEYAKGFQADLDAGGKKLKTEEEALIKEQSNLSREAWEKKAKAFEKKVFDFNQQFQKANVALEKAYLAAMTELITSVSVITQEMAAELSVNLVLYKSQVFLHEPSMDKTDEIIVKLNKKYPTITFPTPEVLPKS